jgi:glycosyltransferase involved in cell wall biosynthesis
MRVCLFTDTLGDVNGVSRFILATADRARRAGRELRVVTSTRMPLPADPCVVNVRPVAAWKMPKYEHLEVALPRWGEMRRMVSAWRPDVVHVSTPGPVGLAGRWIAGRLGLPLVGTYHTDFPAYVERLFEDAVMGAMAGGVMRWFYGPFARILARSEAMMGSMASWGLDRTRMVGLRPGLDTSAFHPRHRDPGVWGRIGAWAGSCVRVVSCGRVSVEKNLPMLCGAWRSASAELRSRGISARLVVVGDGPYLSAMREALSGTPTDFVGFRFGAELSAIYATGDLFVFPSMTDTLGQVSMEAQASGLAVLVSEAGGPRTMMVEGRTGLVVPGRDAGAWARAMVELVADGARRKRMGEAAHEHMRNYGFAESFEHFWRVHEYVRAEASG